MIQRAVPNSTLRFLRRCHENANRGSGIGTWDENFFPNPELRIPKPGFSGPEPRTPNPESRSHGFTLLELLVSITIVSLLATTILFGWRIAASAWQKANDRLEQDRKVRAVHQLLQEQMASMVPGQALVPQKGPELFFQGEPQAARFLSRYSVAYRARSGLFRVEYQVAEQPDGTRQLLLNEFPVTGWEELGSLLTGEETDLQGRRFLRFAPLERGPQSLTLLEGLQECRFEYSRPPRFPEPAAWTAQWWTLGDDLPRAMAIRLVSGSESAGVAPVSIVAAIPHYTRRTQ